MESTIVLIEYNAEISILNVLLKDVADWRGVEGIFH